MAQPYENPGSGSFVVACMRARGRTEFDWRGFWFRFLLLAAIVGLLTTLFGFGWYLLILILGIPDLFIPGLWLLFLRPSGTLIVNGELLSRDGVLVKRIPVAAIDLVRTEWTDAFGNQRQGGPMIYYHGGSPGLSNLVIETNEPARILIELQDADPELIADERGLMRIGT